jgi:ABC-type transport system involved in cytochrome c biogenesis ATPase subunit
MRGIVAFEHRLLDPWLDRIPETMLVSGLNGSGKTTLLDAISALWSNFGSALDGHLNLPALLASCRLAAIKLEKFAHDDPRPVWLFAARLNEWNDLRPWLEGCHFLGLINDGKRRVRLEVSDQAWAKDWQQRRKLSMAGGCQDVPNLVYITSDTRGLMRAPAPGKVPSDEPMRNWHAVYDDKKPLIHSLYRHALTNPTGFADTLKRVNSFLENKRIIGFDENLDLAVETDFGGKHDVYALSTGEQQALILVAFARRWLKPGGILLVDEPDLYMHPSWIEQIVRLLSNLAHDRGGQFLFTSHSPTLWENFSRDAERIRMEIKTLDSAQAAEPAAPNQGAGR